MKRVATGWETQLTIAVDGVISPITVFELCEGFFALRPPESLSSGNINDHTGPGTRLRLCP